MEEQEKINLESLKPVKSGETIDLKQFHSAQVKIEKAEVIQVKSQFTSLDKNGINILQWVLKVSGPPMVTIGEGEDIIEFRPSELFNLSQDKEGKLLGFPENKDSNLTKFLKDIGATNPNEIIGKTATVKHYEKVHDGQTRGYLKWKY